MATNRTVDSQVKMNIEQYHDLGNKELTEAFVVPRCSDSIPLPDRPVRVEE